MKDKKCKTKECKNLINSKLSKSGLCGKCSNKLYKENHIKEIKAYHKKHRKEYYKKNKERELKVNEKYRNSHKVEISKINDKYYKKRRGYYKDKAKEHYENNKKERAKYSLDYANKRYKLDVGFKNRKLLGSALGNVIRHYIKTGRVINPQKKFNIDWKGIIDVLTPIPQPRSAYHVDHIIPLYKFDLSNIEQIHIAFAPENHRWLLIKDNLGRNRPNTRSRKYKID